MIRSPLRSPLNPVLSAVVNRRRSAASDILAGLFAASEQGLWLDPGDMSTMFQDSAGSTPVTAVGQPVGLLLDKSKGLVLGPELVTNGEFTSGTGWTDTGVATITYSAAGARIVSPANGAALLSQNYAGAVNKTYVVDAEVVMHATPAAAAAVAVNIGGGGEDLFVSTQSDLTAGNTYRLHGKVRLTSAFSFLLRIGSRAGQHYALDFTIRNLSVRELPGNHFIQPTSAARPVVSARVNLLTKSEDFSNAVWTGGAVSMVSNKLIPSAGTAALSSKSLRQNVPHYGVPVARTYTIEAKSDGLRYVMLGWHNGGGYISLAVFDTQTSTVVSAGGANNPMYFSDFAATMEALPDGWFRCTVSGKHNSDYAHPAVGGTSALSGPSNWNSTGDGVAGILIRSPQEELGSTATRYQRVNTATDYDTVGFPLGDKFDGIDDGLATATFAAGTLTSNMDCFIAVRRNSAAPMLLAHTSGGSTYIGVMDATAGPVSNLSGTPTYAANGVDVPGGTGTTRIQLATATPVGSWTVVEIRNVDLSTWTAFTVGAYPSFMLNAGVGGVILCPAQTPKVRTQIRQYLGNKVGLSL